MSHNDKKLKEFHAELTHLINRLSLENFSNTPDFIIADYLVECFKNYNNVMQTRERWHGREINVITEAMVDSPPLFYNMNREQALQEMVKESEDLALYDIQDNPLIRK